MEESSVYRAIFRRGRNMGLREGLLLSGTPRFGKPDKIVRQAIESISDPDRLLEMNGRLLGLSTWAELLAVQAPARGRKKRK
jgi:hypothetical protein